MQLAEIIERWDSGDGRPYKGSLIDWRAYEADPENLGCMCAQGQVLHLIGGLSHDDLNRTEQANADKLTADLLKISRAHAVLLRNINDSVDGAPSIVLTDPGKVLGDQWSKLLDFWWHLDQMTPEDWKAWDAARAAAWDAAWDAAGDAAGDAARDAAGDAAGDAARAAAWDAAGDAARDAAGDAAWDAAGDAAWDAAGDAARDAAGASSEIQGASLMRERGQAFFFLPLFGFASPDEIPARPADYGQL
ncbi:hypothetical protein [Sphingobium fuliginis]|uniref:hypothetical protein n=1 Tax=Sphingobium fuliginis (strain ATCC 27551) TaxID=336203 RepID=UPI0037CB5501